MLPRVPISYPRTTIVISVERLSFSLSISFFAFVQHPVMDGGVSHLTFAHLEPWHPTSSQELCHLIQSPLLENLVSCGTLVDKKL